MRTLPRAGAGLLALTLVVIAACGDDDDDETTETTEASGSVAEGDTAAFCDSLVEFNTAAFQVEIDDSTPEEEIKEVGDQLAELTQAMVDNAPEDLAEGTEEIHGIVEPLREGDASAFNSDATFETYLGYLGQATEACEFETVSVDATDYAFDAPTKVAAGNVTFDFMNSSEAEEHEMVVFRKADGVDLTWQEILELGEEGSQDKMAFKAVAFAGPGEGGSTLATLDAGEYAMICFLPVGGAEDGPPHFTQGMLHEFTVE